MGGCLQVGAHMRAGRYHRRCGTNPINHVALGAHPGADTFSVPVVDVFFEVVRGASALLAYVTHSDSSLNELIVRLHFSKGERSYNGIAVR